MWNITIKTDGKKIEPSSHVKYLGILIDSFLIWNFHIDELSTKFSCADTFHGLHGKFQPYLYGSQFGDKVINQSQKWKNYKNTALRIINFKTLKIFCKLFI